MSPGKPRNDKAAPDSDNVPLGRRDYDVGYKRPPTQHRWKKGQSGNPKRRRAARSISTIEMIDRLLMRPIEIVENGVSKKVPAVTVIVRHLLQLELEGKPRAVSVRLEYERIAGENTEPSVEIELFDSDYTRALSTGQSTEGTDDE